MPITHPVQRSILKELLFNPHARFAELNVTGLTNDHFSFHIKKLVELGIVEKSDEHYTLTTKGRELAGRLDIQKKKFLPQPKLGVSIFVSRMRDGQREILLGERLKDPSRGEIGWFTEKIQLGESAYQTARRCLLRETGLHAEFAFVGVERFIRKRQRDLEVDVVLLCFFGKKGCRETAGVHRGKSEFLDTS